MVNGGQEPAGAFPDSVQLLRTRAEGAARRGAERHGNDPRTAERRGVLLELVEEFVEKARALELAESRRQIESLGGHLGEGQLPVCLRRDLELSGYLVAYEREPAENEAQNRRRQHRQLLLPAGLPAPADGEWHLDETKWGFARSTAVWIVLHQSEFDVDWLGTAHRLEDAGVLSEPAQLRSILYGTLIDEPLVLPAS